MIFKHFAIAAALATVIGSAAAQTPAHDKPNNGAVNSSSENNSNAPVAGSNSFTQGQAKSRIEQAGYSDVSDLNKDDKGVWRGTASKSGTKSDVSLDFQGNVNSSTK
jgi:hypothetical protein